MKKLLITVIVLLVVSTVVIYLFIPATLTVSRNIMVSCTDEGAKRFIHSPARWQAMLTVAQPADSAHSFTYKNATYTIIENLHSAADIDINFGDKTISSSAYVLPYRADTAIIQWVATLTAGGDPVSRLNNYRTAVALRQHIDDIALQLKSYLSDSKNVYGLPIGKSSTTDTTLMSTKTILPHYPTTGDIYNNINKVKHYLAANNQPVTGSPIMNVTRMNDSAYQLMVAVPTSKRLPDAGDVFYRHMLPGVFLVASAQGGDKAVAQANNMLQQYIADYHKTVMAIPFQALLTDRQTQPDTTKWLTRIYYPVSN